MVDSSSPLSVGVGSAADSRCQIYQRRKNLRSLRPSLSGRGLSKTAPRPKRACSSARNAMSRERVLSIHSSGPNWLLTPAGDRTTASEVSLLQSLCFSRGEQVLAPRSIRHCDSVPVPPWA